MTKLILINGQGGAGKSTTARHLLRMLHPAAYIPTDSLISVEPFEWGEELLSLGMRNAHLLIRSFADTGYDYIILCGLLPNQTLLNRFLAEMEPRHSVLYAWLRATQETRDQRRLQRARDDADQQQHFNFLDKLIPDLTQPLNVPDGAFIEVDTSNLTPDQVAQEIRKHFPA